MVLGRNADEIANGGVQLDYQYSSFVLGNTDDEVELVDPLGAVVNVFTYFSAIVFNGSSVSLNPDLLDAPANDLEANWCVASSPLPRGDTGTAGYMNDPCP